MEGHRLLERLSAGFVFGYGSLAGASQDGYPARLHGWRRRWGVAMDNAVTLPGYKYYVGAGGERPDVCVAFLDIEPQAGAWANGICVPVSEPALAELDDRERNYERVEITRAIEPLVGRTWAYVGRDDSRRRFAAALLSAQCVVARSYLETVEEGFRAHGEWEAFEASTYGARPPVRELRRVDI